MRPTSTIAARNFHGPMPPSIVTRSGTGLVFSIEV